MPSKALHVVAYDMIFFFLKETYYSVLWAPPRLICSPTDRLLHLPAPPPTAGVAVTCHTSSFYVGCGNQVNMSGQMSL